MSILKGFRTVVFLFLTALAAAESAKVDYSVHSVRRGNLMMYTVLISSLLRSFHAGCSESTGDEEG